MKMFQKEFYQQEWSYVIRQARKEDAKELAEVRLRIDGETVYMDRERGEDYLDSEAFSRIIEQDDEKENHLFLVAEAKGQIAGFSRCIGNDLRRSAHRAEFGVCVLQEFWGHGIGRHLLEESIKWADEIGLEKITLTVLKTNTKAIHLYEKNGFEVEGILKKDKRLSDGTYYDTLIMSRFKEEFPLSKGNV